MRDDLELLSDERILLNRVSFFDSLALLSVFTFYGKVLILDLWRTTYQMWMGSAHRGRRTSGFPATISVVDFHCTFS